MSLEEQRELGKIAAELRGLRHARAAVLHAPGFNMNAVVDVAAQTGGMALAEFITESEAESWLLQDTPVTG
jgi:hypothetical protein